MEILVFLLEFLFDVVFQMVFQLLIETAIELVLEAPPVRFVRRRRAPNPIFTGLSLAIVGAVVGLVSAWILPRRVLPPMPHLAGASLVLAPLGTGGAMHALGMWRR